jgi:hypothetical protein
MLFPARAEDPALPVAPNAWPKLWPLVENVIRHVPVRQWVLFVPERLRPFLHHRPSTAGASLHILLRALPVTLKEASATAPSRPLVTEGAHDDDALAAQTPEAPPPWPEAPAPRSPDALPSPWAALLARVSEVFPLFCPSCHTPLFFHRPPYRPRAHCPDPRHIGQLPPPPRPPDSSPIPTTARTSLPGLTGRRGR